MKSYHTNGCMDRNRAIEDKEEEESAKKEKKEKEETSARIRVTMDGKHIIQTGSIIVTPDGKHETVVSDCGGVIITASGEHILAPYCLPSIHHTLVNTKFLVCLTSPAGSTCTKIS